MSALSGTRISQTFLTKLDEFTTMLLEFLVVIQIFRRILNTTYIGNILMPGGKLSDISCFVTCITQKHVKNETDICYYLFLCHHSQKIREISCSTGMLMYSLFSNTVTECIYYWYPCGSTAFRFSYLVPLFSFFFGGGAMCHRVLMDHFLGNVD